MHKHPINNRVITQQLLHYHQPFSLFPVPSINISGAVCGTIDCYMISTVINFITLQKKFKLNLNLYNFIIKPAIVTGVVGITSYYLYQYVSVISLSNIVAVVCSVLG